jgi:transposase
VNGLKELAAISGAPIDTIYSWWQKWFRLGLLVESETRKGRMAKIVSLDDVGIKTSKKSKVTPSAKSHQTQQTDEGQSASTGREIA